MGSRPECVLVLASASPRRRRLISALGLPVSFMSVETAEELDTPLASRPDALASHLAAEKAVVARAERAACVAAGGNEARSDAEVVVAFDTIVVLDAQVLGKPKDLDDAWRMLHALAGRTHRVVTGVAIAPPGEEPPLEFAVSTRVRMKPLTDEDIEAWMARGEFMGCAGAYNIEGQVAEVDGDECFQNVAGLPLCHLHAALEAMELPCDLANLVSPIARCDRILGRRCDLGPRLK